jgi:ATP-binding cassette, subfamily G (WHITE), member 2, PDR
MVVQSEFSSLARYDCPALTVYSLVPSYPNLVGSTFVCAVNGAVSGQSTVSGDAYVEASFQYNYSHIWRNLGIVIAFYVFFLAAYLVVSELNSGTSSTAEVLLFLRRSTKAKAGGLQLPSQQKTKTKENSEMSAEENGQPKSVFTWRNVTYDIHIKNEPRRLLDNVSGWAKPGTLTALMGVSGAGKTTLLDVLAQRTSVGVVSGDMFVNGKSFDSSFQRKLGIFLYIHVC